MHLKYVGIRVRDLDRALRFYTETMGLEEVLRGDLRESGFGGGVWVTLEDPVTHHRLELNWYPPESRFAPPFTPGEGLDHIGFGVSDVDATFRKLVEAGVEPTDVTPEATDGRLAFLKDPDGNWIELFRPS